MARKKQLPSFSDLQNARIKSISRLTAQSHRLYAPGSEPLPGLSSFLSDLYENRVLASVDKAVIELMHLHGLRISEVLNILPNHVLLDGSITIKGLKGSNNRLVKSLSYTKFWIDNRVSFLPLNTIYSRFYFYRLFQKLGYSQKFGSNKKRSVTHFFRHSYVQNLKNQNVADEDISLFLGHKSAKSLKSYA